MSYSEDRVILVKLVEVWSRKLLLLLHLVVLLRRLVVVLLQELHGGSVALHDVGVLLVVEGAILHELRFLLELFQEHLYIIVLALVSLEGHLINGLSARDGGWLEAASAYPRFGS